MGEVTADLVRSQVGKIVQSQGFVGSERISRFLTFVVEETLAGRDAQLKGYTIALEVFGREPDFDPQTSSLVRVEAGRLRQRLERYYLAEGRNAPVQIILERGTYAPRFELRREAPAESAAADVAVLPMGPSIAVLPFDHLGGDADQAYFAAGITEEVVNDLAKFPDLKVIARRSTQHYSDRAVSLTEIAEELGVSYVLAGSVRRGGTRIRVTVELVEAADGSIVLADSFDRTLTPDNLLDVQEDMADRIVSAVASPTGTIRRIGGRRARRKETKSLDAYDAVLRFYAYWLDPTRADYRDVRGLLERSVQLDPHFGSAWAALSLLVVDGYRQAFDPPREEADLALTLDAARRAVAIDRESSMAHQALAIALFHQGDIAGFREAGERALGLNPNQTDLLVDIAIGECCLGNMARALALTDKALALTPHPAPWFHVVHLVDHLIAGRHDQAIAACRRVHMAESFWSALLDAATYRAAGAEAMAEAAADRAIALNPRLATDPDAELDKFQLTPLIAGLLRTGLGARIV